ncbi:MAG: YceI family protein [Micromonosporaceae bacterium]|jgi:polyisoprenoid-binding protein YceI
MTDTAVRTWNGLTIPAPGLYVLDEPHRRVGFQAEHLMVSTVRGEFTRVAATILVAEDPMQSAVTAVIEAASITTGHEERDAHLRSPDFLDVDRYPTLTYRSTGMRRYEENPIFQWARLRTLGRNGPAGHPDTLTRQSLSVARKFILTGELTVKGVTRPVDLDVTYTGTRRNPDGRQVFGFQATAEIDRTDFGLVWNVPLDAGGVLVGRKVAIELVGEAVRQPM